MKKKMKEMNEFHQPSDNYNPQKNQSQFSSKPNSKADYIDFEEIK